MYDIFNELGEVVDLGAPEAETAELET